MRCDTVHTRRKGSPKKDNTSLGFESRILLFYLDMLLFLSICINALLVDRLLEIAGTSWCSQIGQLSFGLLDSWLADNWQSYGRNIREIPNGSMTCSGLRYDKQWKSCVPLGRVSVVAPQQFVECYIQVPEWTWTARIFHGAVVWYQSAGYHAFALRTTRPMCGLHSRAALLVGRRFVSQALLRSSPETGDYCVSRFYQRPCWLLVHLRFVGDCTNRLINCCDIWLCIEFALRKLLKLSVWMFKKAHPIAHILWVGIRLNPPEWRYWKHFVWPDCL